MASTPHLQLPEQFAPDPRQREILDLLALLGPEPVAYFSDCCRIMAGAAGVVAQTHLAAHLLREIEGRLHEVFEPMLSGEARQRISEARDRESHRAKIEQAARILGLEERTAEQWLAYALELHRFAHRYSLAGARDVAEFPRALRRRSKCSSGAAAAAEPSTSTRVRCSLNSRERDTRRKAI